MFPHFKIVAVGRVKNPELKSLLLTYKQRLAPFCKLEEIELAATPFKRESDKQKAKKQEGERILAYIKKNSSENIFLLEEVGKEFSSVALAEKIADLNGCITFVIAGALGFSDEIKRLNLPKLSLSQLTLPHELARLVLLEQLYRATKINNNQPYHY